MKASRFSDAQKAFILKQGRDGILMADICRKAGIGQATYFNWKKKGRTSTVPSTVSCRMSGQFRSPCHKATSSAAPVSRCRPLFHRDPRACRTIQQALEVEACELVLRLLSYMCRESRNGVRIAGLEFAKSI